MTRIFLIIWYDLFHFDFESCFKLLLMSNSFRPFFNNFELTFVVIKSGHDSIWVHPLKLGSGLACSCQADSSLTFASIKDATMLSDVLTSTNTMLFNLRILMHSKWVNWKRACEVCIIELKRKIKVKLETCIPKCCDCRNKLVINVLK